MIKVEHLAFSFPGSEKPLFHNLSFQAEAGEHIALVGPSGSGKTTLMHIMAGLQLASKGVVSYKGQQVDPRNDTAVSRLRNGDMGIVFQDYNLIKDLTVEENLKLRLSLAGMEHESNRMAEMLEKVDMLGFMKSRVGNLSGGQQQRVAAIRALITRPTLLLADEPTGNLDDHSADYVIDMLTEPHSDRIVITATHDQRILKKFKTIELASLEAFS